MDRFRFAPRLRHGFGSGVLRHRLEQRREGGSLVVSVVSPGASEGKTSLAARLALTLSESERARVVVVEDVPKEPEASGLLGARRDLGHRNRLKSLPHEVEGIGGRGRDCVVGTKCHLLRPAAPRYEAYADLDEPDIGFGCRPHAGRT